jgi:hypothetical protein
MSEYCRLLGLPIPLFNVTVAELWRELRTSRKASLLVGSGVRSEHVVLAACFVWEVLR